MYGTGDDYIHPPDTPSDINVEPPPGIVGDQAHSRGVSALGLYILWGTKGISIVFLLLVS